MKKFLSIFMVSALLFGVGAPISSYAATQIIDDDGEIVDEWNDPGRQSEHQTPEAKPSDNDNKKPEVKPSEPVVVTPTAQASTNTNTTKKTSTNSNSTKKSTTKTSSKSTTSTSSTSTSNVATSTDTTTTDTAIGETSDAPQTRDNSMIPYLTIIVCMLGIGEVLIMKKRLN